MRQTTAIQAVEGLTRVTLLLSCFFGAFLAIIELDKGSGRILVIKNIESHDGLMDWNKTLYNSVFHRSLKT